MHPKGVIVEINAKLRSGVFPVSTKMRNSKVDSKDGTLDIKDGNDGVELIMGY